MTDTITDNKYLLDALVRGIKRDDIHMVARLLKAGAHSDRQACGRESRPKRMNEGLPAAVLNGYDENGMAPLHIAALYRRFEIFEMLLGCQDIDINAVTQDKERWTVLGLLCRSDNLESIRSIGLLEQTMGAEFASELKKPVNQDKETLLHVAARHGNSDFIAEVRTHR